MMLYHGSNVPIETIDLSRCKPYKDFGRGFYLTSLTGQARAMAVRTTKLYGSGSPFVTSFEFDPEQAEHMGLRVLTFDEPTREWAEFVMNNRDRDFSDVDSALCNRLNQYDIVIGPVADDRIAASFNLFSSGFINLDQLTERLRFRKLNNQYSFHTERACKLLIPKGLI